MLQSKISRLLTNASELCEDRKYAKALKYYDKVLQIEPDNLKANVDKGVTLQNLGCISKAIQMYEKALILEPENLDALINMGSALHTLEKYTEAIYFYNIEVR